MKLTTRQIAEIIHEAQRGYQSVLTDLMPSPPWWCLDVRQQAIIMLSVDAAKAGANPAQLHQLWAENMLADGWRWGNRKDPGEKTHPDLVPWGKLPAQEQAKDELHHAIVAWAMSLA